ncbi:MAG TPA: hypothetical protein VF713_22900 [Thermoanaerobaculia bacterium]
MPFDKRQWISEMIGGSITGGIAGMIGAIFVPDSPFAIAVAAGGAAGLATGLVSLPVKALLDWRPRNKPGQSVKSSAPEKAEKPLSKTKKCQAKGG